MLLVDDPAQSDPRLNLALEEHLLRNVELNEPILLFYQNAPSVIIGRNQNTLEEIDPEYVQREGLQLVRRLSGGGAVYHDLGNLNFSFVTPSKEGLHDFARFTGPVVQALRELGVPAELRGKSDIFAAGKKVSGNAQYASGGRMFSHGTLLFNTDLEAMLKALNPRQVAIESRAVQSVRNYVANLCELLPAGMSLAELKAALLAGLFGRGEPPRYALGPADREQVEAIAAGRYRRWEWNIGHSPRFNVRKSAQTPAGKVDARIEVENGRVAGIRFYGDFEGRRDVAELEERLIGVRYDAGALGQALADLDPRPYFGELPAGQLRDLLY